MTKLSIFFLFSLTILTITGCAPDPRNAADARRTDILSAQTAMDQVQSRNQQASEDAIALQEQQALLSQKISSTQLLIYWGFIAAAFATFVAISGFGIGLAWASIASGKAWARFIQLRSSLIPLNALTRQFPLIFQYLGHGKYSLANPNTEQVTLLDTSNPSDRHMITVMGAVQLAGAIATEARRSKDGGQSIATIQPNVITADMGEIHD